MGGEVGPACKAYESSMVVVAGGGGKGRQWGHRKGLAWRAHTLEEGGARAGCGGVEKRRADTPACRHRGAHWCRSSAEGLATDQTAVEGMWSAVP